MATRGSSFALSRVRSRSYMKRFSVLHRPSPNYDDHIPLSIIEKGALAAGSAVMALLNPRRDGRVLPHFWF